MAARRSGRGPSVGAEVPPGGAPRATAAAAVRARGRPRRAWPRCHAPGPRPRPPARPRVRGPVQHRE